MASPRNGTGSCLTGWGRRRGPGGAVAVTVCVAVCCGITVAQMPSTDVSAIVARGVELARSGNYAQAVAAFEQALALSPGNRDARYNLGLACYNAGDYRRAVAEFQRVLAAEPTAVDARKGLGLAQLALRRYPEAVRSLQAVLQATPGDTGCLLALGRAYLGAGNPRKAIPPLREAARLQPLDASIVFELGKALAATGDHAGAKEAFGRALALKPDSVLSAVGLARAQNALGDHAGATQTLRPFAERTPPDRHVLSALAEAYDGLGLANEALQTRIRLAELLPPAEGSALRLRLAEACVKKERWAEAQRLYRTVAEADPANVEAFIGLARCSRAQGQTEEEIAHWRTAAQLAPKRAGLWMRLAEALKTGGRPAEALGALGEALAVAPDDAAVLREGATLARGLGDLRLAESFLRRVLAADPADFSARMAVVDILADRGQPLKALLEAGEALRAPDPPAQAYRKVAQLAERLGNLELAIAQWRQLVKLGGEGELDAALELGRLLVKAHSVPEAITVYRSQLQKHPDAPPVVLAMARAWQAIGKDQEAVALLEPSLRGAPEFTEARVALAQSLSWLGRHDEARREMQRVLAAPPLSEAACRTLVLVCQRSGQPEEAVAILHQLLPEAGPQATILELLRELHRELGTSQAGGERLAGLFDQHPDHVSLGLAGAALLGDAGRFEEAEVLLRGIAQRAAHRQAALRQLVCMYADSDRAVRGLEPLRRLLAPDLSTAGVVAMLAELESRPDLVQQNRSLVRRLAQADPGTPEFWAAGADLTRFLGRVPTQLARLQALLDQTPGHPGLATGVALLALADGRPAIAEAAIARVPDENRTDRALFSALAQAQAALGKSENAMSSLRHAIRCGPPQADDHRMLGQLLRQAHSPEEALWHFVLALAIAPTDAQTAQAVGELIAADELPPDTVLRGLRFLHSRHPGAPVVFDLVEALAARPNAGPLCDQWLRLHPRPAIGGAAAPPPAQEGVAPVGAPDHREPTTTEDG